MYKKYMNKNQLKALLLQACEDIKDNADEIVEGIDELKNITISICFVEEYFPYITINKNYNKYITFTKEIENTLLEE